MFEKDEEVTSCDPGSSKGLAGSQGAWDQGAAISRAPSLARALSLSPLFPSASFACGGSILSCRRPASSTGQRWGGGRGQATRRAWC